MKKPRMQAESSKSGFTWLLNLSSLVLKGRNKLSDRSDSEEMITLQKNKSLGKVSKAAEFKRCSLKTPIKSGRNSELNSVLSDDDAQSKQHKANKYRNEESKGKVSDSNEDKKANEMLSDKLYIKHPYMKGNKLNDIHEPDTPLEYFYEFGEK